MKRLRLGLVGLFLALGLGGCVSQEQRDAAIEKLALEAKDKAYAGAFKEAVNRGVNPEQAKEIAEKAADLAYRTTKEAAAKIPTTGGLGQILTTILYGLVQFGLPMLGRKAEA